jgi:peptide/nickel transport system ATP-binding protein
MTIMTPLLKIQRLTVHFGTGRNRREILSDVNLDVYPGETLGIVGESGSGKTTLARAAMRLIPPSGGTIEFDGLDLLRLQPHELRQKRRHFQIIFQDSAGSLDPRLTIREILMEPYQAHRLGSKAARAAWIGELLAAVSLNPEILGRRPSELSGGQQQRVGIARALALKPRLLVADEPVSALDASVQAQILNLLDDLKRRYGLTLIIVTHSLPVVRYLCSRVVVLNAGRIAADKPAEAYFARTAGAEANP